MEITVKEITKEQKSTQEIEQELLDKHESSLNAEQAINNEAPPVEEENAEQKQELEDKTPSSELNDEDVLKYIKTRYDKDISSVDDLFTQTKDNDELPEDVSAYLKYKKETGRGIKDFYNLQKDFDTMDADQVLADYYGETEEGLDAIDIQDLMEDKFSYDEDEDEPKEVKKLKLVKKRELAKAKKYFVNQKDKYKVPLESSGDGLSDKEKESLNAYKGYIEESKTIKEANQKKYDYFLKKTDEVFSNEFKGFEFSVGEKDFTFKSGDAQELKSRQSDVNTFLSKYMDKDGLVNDAKGYHKALSVAMNPDRYAKFFYDQGAADAVDNVSKKSKNINMDVRQSQQSGVKNGAGIRAMGGQNESGRGLKIRSIKKI